MFLKSTSKISAAILSYIVLFFTTISSILLTPILLKYMGVDEYGLYQLIYSFGRYVLLLDLGIGSVMVRYISEYRAKKDIKTEQNFSAIMGVITLIAVILLVSIGIILNVNLESIFTELTSSDYEKSHQMFFLMIIQFAILLLSHYYGGVIKAYEKFNFSQVISFATVILSFFLTIALVKYGLGAVGIVFANLLVSVLALVAQLVFAHVSLNFKIYLYKWDWLVLKAASGLMLALLLQSIIGFVNLSVGKTILGIVCTKTDVAIYAVALTLVTMFNTIPTLLSNFFQPKVMQMIVANASKSELTTLVIRVGRWQFALCGAVLGGLILFGQDFLHLWIGRSFDSSQLFISWLVILIILPFNMIPLVQNVCISILNGFDKRMDRSLILLGSSIFNVILAIILVHYFGVVGIAIASALSFAVGYGFVMNYYYSKVIGLEVKRMFMEILHRTLLCVVLSIALAYPLLLWNTHGWGYFVLECVAYSVIFFLLMYFRGFNKEEKGILKSLFFKILRKKTY